MRQPSYFPSWRPSFLASEDDFSLLVFVTIINMLERLCLRLRLHESCISVYLFNLCISQTYNAVLCMLIHRILGPDRTWGLRAMTYADSQGTKAMLEWSAAIAWSWRPPQRIGTKITSMI